MIQSPVIRTVLVVFVALVCAGMAVAIAVRLARYVLDQVRKMRPTGADSAEAGKARVAARRKIKNLAFLCVFSAVPATLSYSHLIEYAHTALDLHGGLQYLVPLALDEAAMYVMMLAFGDVDAGESAAANRTLVWAFVAGSAWFNWIQAPRGTGHTGAPEFFALMSVAAGVLFERGLVAVRRDHDQATGKGRRPLPRFGVLRWLTAPVETASMMRLAITEPTITTEADALAAVRLRRAIADARRQAEREARAEAAAAAPAQWWRRRVVVATAQPVVSLPTGTTAPAAAVATVLAPYARAIEAQELPDDSASPLALEPVLRAAAQIGTPAEQERAAEELAEHVERIEALATEAEKAVLAHGAAHSAATNNEPGTPAHDGLAAPAHSELPADEPLAECVEEDQDEPAVKTAAAHGVPISPRITTRVPEQRDEEPQEPRNDAEAAELDLTRYATKRAKLEALYEARIRPDDPRTNNAIAEALLEEMAQHGVTLDRGAANRYVGELRSGSSPRLVA